MNTRLLKHGLPPLITVPHIDTCSIAKSKLKLSSNALNVVADTLGCTLKMQHSGWKMWVDVRNGDKKAMEMMSKYCKQDVDTLEEVFYKLRPLAKNIPNYNHFVEGKDPFVCPHCGSDSLNSYGYKYTKTGRTPKYLCKDCGSVSTTDTKGRKPRSF